MELVLDSFTQLAGIDERRDGEFTTRRLVLEAFERLGETNPIEPGEHDGRRSGSRA